MNCRVCGSDAGQPVLDHPGPSITSMASLLNGPTRLYCCPACSHLSTAEIANPAAYYQNHYDTAGAEEDDLMALDAAGEPIYRIQRQVDCLRSMLDVETSGRLLDFGCGHGAFMQRFRSHYPRWSVQGFEVSPRYAADDVFIGELPDGPYDVITAFFVFEHLPRPVETARQLARRLSKAGWLVLVVPNAADNPADVLAVDHLSHFGDSSLRLLLASADCAIVQCATGALPGCWLAVGSPAESIATTSAVARVEAQPFAPYFRQVEVDLLRFLDATDAKPRSIAIYGAGVYGAYLLSRAGLPPEALACFIDRNERKQQTAFLGLPVVSPDRIPHAVETVLLGVRPDQVDAVLAMRQLADRRCFSLPPWRAPCTA